MEFTESQKKETEKRLKAVEHAYGAIPPVNQILSERPDMFIPNFDLGDSLFREKTVFDIKTKHLFALAAAAALSGEYCMKAQMAHAKDAGATDEEVLEVLESHRIWHSPRANHTRSANTQSSTKSTSTEPKLGTLNF